MMRITSGTILITTAALLPPVAIIAPLGTAPLLGATIFGLVLTGAARDSWPALRRDPVFLILCTLAIWAAISLLWSPETAKGVRTVAKIAVLFTGGMMAVDRARCLDTQDRRRCGIALIAGMTIALAYLSIDIYSNGLIRSLFLNTTDGQKFYPYMLNRPVTIVAMLVWPVAIALGTKYPRWTLWLFLLFALAVLSGSASATAVTALTAGIAVFALSHLAFPRDILRRIVLAGLIVALLALPLFKGVSAHIESWNPNSSVQNSLVHRLFIWDFAATRAMEKPITGRGIEASRGLARHIPQDDSWQPGETLLEVKKKYFRSASMPLHPHSAGLQIWAELGLVGILLVCAWLCATFRAIGRLPGSSDLCALFVTGFAIASAGFGIWQSWWLSTLWLSAILAVAVKPRPDDGP